MRFSRRCGERFRCRSGCCRGGCRLPRRQTQSSACHHLPLDGFRFAPIQFRLRCWRRRCCQSRLVQPNLLIRLRRNLALGSSAGVIHEDACGGRLEGLVAIEAPGFEGVPAVALAAGVPIIDIGRVVAQGTHLPIHKETHIRSLLTAHAHLDRHYTRHAGAVPRDDNGDGGGGVGREFDRSAQGGEQSATRIVEAHGRLVDAGGQSRTAELNLERACLARKLALGNRHPANLHLHQGRCQSAQLQRQPIRCARQQTRRALPRFMRRYKRRHAGQRRNVPKPFATIQTHP